MDCRNRWPADQTEVGRSKRLEANSRPPILIVGPERRRRRRAHYFTGTGRFFAPFKDHFAVQTQAEYMYYRTRRKARATSVS